MLILIFQLKGKSTQPQRLMPRGWKLVSSSLSLFSSSFSFLVAQMKALMSTLPAGQRQVVLEELKPEEAKGEEAKAGETTVTELDDAGQVM
jgi:hypothetical protein